MRMSWKLLACALPLLGATPLLAQHQQHQPGQHHGNPARPYADFAQRDVKALSETQIADLRAGRGMGLALAAELNGYPGPMHALELADALGLDAAQRSALQAQFERMRTEAIAAGARVIAAETALDRAFAERRIDAQRLAALTADAGAAQAELRATHLKYHLETAALMTPDQRQRYAELRGYR